MRKSVVGDVGNAKDADSGSSLKLNLGRPRTQSIDDSESKIVPTGEPRFLLLHGKRIEAIQCGTPSTASPLCGKVIREMLHKTGFRALSRPYELGPRIG
jgi:hypothetical protein